MTLDSIQLRVLGALIEKEITTPESYPLSLNSLLSACNQRSSRDPVLDLTEEEVRQAVHSLEDMEIVAPVRDARVPKYEHRIRTVLNLRRDETAVLCLLLLRGPQTPGELRGRADRMFSFDDIAAVQSTLERLAARTADSDPTGTGPLIVQLARQPGSRESRYAHLLGGPVAEKSQANTPSSGDRFTSRPSTLSGPTMNDPNRQHLLERIEVLEAALAALDSRLHSLETADRKTRPEQAEPNQDK